MWRYSKSRAITEPAFRSAQMLSRVAACVHRSGVGRCTPSKDPGQSDPELHAHSQVEDLGETLTKSPREKSMKVTTALSPFLADVDHGPGPKLLAQPA